MHRKLCAFSFGVALLLCAIALPASGFEVVNGAKAAVILLPENAQESSKLAARELSDYVQKVSGTALSIETGKAGKKPCIVIGTLATLPDIPAEIVKKLDAAKQREAFFIKAAGQTMYIVGKDEVAELYGTYYFLEDKLGVRWLKAANPHDSGEYVPQSKTIVFPDYELFREPAFSERRLDQCASYGNVIPVEGKRWAYRNGFQAPVAYGGRVPYDKPESDCYKFYAPRIPRYTISLGGGHTTFVTPQPAKTAFEQHPEYFALIDGQRVKGEQYCISNKEVQENTANHIISMLDKYNGEGRYLFGMVDVNAGWCECENCRALDGSDTVAAGFQNVSTRFHKVVKVIADKVFAKYPKADLRVWAYHTYRQLPDGVKFDPRLKVQYCPHGRCYGHALDDPSCPRNVKLYQLLKDWLEIAPEIYTYDYLIPTSPYYTCNEKIQAHDLRLYKKLGMIGWKDEAYFEDAKPYPPRKNDTRPDVFPSNWQWLYVTGKILWDPSLDEDQLLDEAESLYYGKAYPAMKKYQALRRKLWANTPQCMGYPTRDQRRPNLLNVPGSKEELLGYLDEADTLAGGDETLNYRIGLDRRWLNDYWIKPNEVLKAKFGNAFRAPTAKGRIVIDGDGKDPAWVGAFYTDNFLETFTDAHAPIHEQLKTTVGILSDDANLYFLVTALEPNPGQMKMSTEKDSSVWDDDSCEFFLYPPSAANSYYQIAVNPLGTVFDALQPGARTDFDIGVEVKAKILADRYVIEMRVPVEKMCAISRGDIWRVHFARNRRIKDSLLPAEEYGGAFSIDGAHYHDTNAYRPLEIGNPYVANGSFDDLDENGKLKGWTLRGKDSKVVKAGKGYQVELHGNIYHLMASGDLGQKTYPRKISYTFKASGTGKLSVMFYRYRDRTDPKAKHGYRRENLSPHGLGGTYELTPEMRVYAGEYTIPADEWNAFVFDAADAVIDDLSVKLIK